MTEAGKKESLLHLTVFAKLEATLTTTANLRIHIEFFIPLSCLLSPKTLYLLYSQSSSHTKVKELKKKINYYFPITLHIGEESIH